MNAENVMTVFIMTKLYMANRGVLRQSRLRFRGWRRMVQIKLGHVWVPESGVVLGEEVELDTVRTALRSFRFELDTLG